MVNWFRSKRKEVPPASTKGTPAAFMASDGAAPLPTLTNLLNLAHGEIRTLKKKYEQLESARLDVQLERDNLHETLRVLCDHALKMSTTHSEGFKWDGKALPSRAAIHDLLLGRLDRMSNDLQHSQHLLRAVSAQEERLRKEVQSLTGKLHESETHRAFLEGEVARALGEFGLANDKHNLETRKSEYLSLELAKLHPLFKHINAEKQAEKAAKDARKAAEPPPITQSMPPPIDPLRWTKKPV